MNIKQISNQLKLLHQGIDRLNNKIAKLMNEFYLLYPELRNENESMWVIYYGVEYVITHICFDSQTVLLETAPYCEVNESVKISFELFDEIYKESRIVDFQ